MPAHELFIAPPGFLADRVARRAGGQRVWLVGMMAIPEPGVPWPADLPPLPHSGWTDRPYTETWGAAGESVFEQPQPRVQKGLQNAPREFELHGKRPARPQRRLARLTAA
jgi:hypothetical protein